MDLFLLQHEKWQLLYNNCSQIEPTPIPWEQRRHFFESVLLIILCVLYYLLYLPCMFSFWRNLKDENGTPNSCYQLMFYISIVDMSILWILGLYIGIEFLYGNVYCTHPYGNYLIGLMALSLIMSEAMADVTLALNRCVDILSNKWSEKLFKGKRIWFWLSASILWGLQYTLFLPPLVFNGFTIALTNNPYYGIWDDGGLVFHNPLALDCNQFMLFFGTPSIYALFLIGLIVKMKSYNHSSESISKAQRAAFFQVFLISMFNMVASSLYYLKEQFPAIISPGFIFVAHFAWFHIHGIPPVIYITFNKTIRQDIRMLYMKIFKRSRVGHMHGVTILIRTQLTQQLESANRMVK